MARYLPMSIWLTALMVLAGSPAAAEQKKPAAKAPQPQGNQPKAQPPQAATPGPGLPDAFKLNLMIRSSIIALNQANQTGNYTVLQDLGAPAFRASNNSGKLAQIFGALRQRKLELSPVLFFTPKLLAQPQVAPNGLLRLTGFFPTAPERVNFDLIYQMHDDQWRLFGISVGTSAAEATSATPPNDAAKQPTAAAAPALAPQAAQTPPPAPSNTASPDVLAPPSKAAQKPDAAPRPNRKSQAESQSGTKKQSGAANDATVVQNGATNNAARTDLANPKTAAGEPAPGAIPPDAAVTGAPKKQPGPWDGLDLFGTD
jgi:hypothetical protein